MAVVVVSSRNRTRAWSVIHRLIIALYESGHICIMKRGACIIYFSVQVASHGNVSPTTFAWNLPSRSNAIRSQYVVIFSAVCPGSSATATVDYALCRQAGFCSVLTEKINNIQKVTGEVILSTGMWQHRWGGAKPGWEPITLLRTLAYEQWQSYPGHSQVNSYVCQAKTNHSKSQLGLPHYHSLFFLLE